MQPPVTAFSISFLSDEMHLFPAAATAKRHARPHGLTCTLERPNSRTPSRELTMEWTCRFAPARSDLWRWCRALDRHRVRAVPIAGACFPQVVTIKPSPDPWPGLTGLTQANRTTLLTLLALARMQLCRDCGQSPKWGIFTVVRGCQDCRDCSRSGWLFSLSGSPP
jgi:hypothetical protein